MNFRHPRAVVIALLSLLFGIPADGAVQNRPDAMIAREVARSVNTYERYTVFDDVQARVDGGVVTLEGKVTLAFKKEEIARRVAAIGGVTTVRNEIAVLPASASDDELRQRVARAIYGNAAFWRYANMPNPPIHIVVEDGRVMLTGIVGRDSDRTLARSLATGLGETSLDCRLEVAAAGVRW